MKYLKTFEHSVNEYNFFINNVRYDLLVVDDEELGTYKYNVKREYELAGPLSVEEYVKEKMLNNKCEFYCNSCWTNHTGYIVDLEVFDPASFRNEEPCGPWVKVKFNEWGDKNVNARFKSVFKTFDAEWHDIDPYNQITVYGEESDLSKKHNKIRQEIADQKEAIQKYNL